MRKGSKHTPESLERLRNALKGRQSPNKGKKLSEAHKRHLSESHKGYKMPESTKAKMRLVVARGVANPLYRHGKYKDPGHIRWLNRQYRLRKYAADGSHTLAEWENLKAQYNWTCPCCQIREPEVTLTIDHIIPLSKGGSDNIENIQPLCKPCNSRKYTKTIKYQVT